MDTPFGPVRVNRQVFKFDDSSERSRCPDIRLSVTWFLPSPRWEKCQHRGLPPDPCTRLGLFRGGGLQPSCADKTFMGNVSETPTPTTCLTSTAAHLQFVRQYAPHLYCRTFLASKLRRKGNPAIRLPLVLHYASHLYGSTPPHLYGSTLEKYWGLGKRRFSGRGLGQQLFNFQSPAVH